MLTKTFADLSYFEKRRERLNREFPNSVFIFFSGKESHLARFRPKSSFVYFTGFEDPESIAVIKTGKDFQYSLFVRDKDPAIEIWDGERYGVEKTKQIFSPDTCYSTADTEAHLPELFRGIDDVYHYLGDDIENDELVLFARKQAQQMDRRSGRAMAAIKDPREVENQFRVIKDELEVQCMRESCELSAQSHIAVMKAVRPGMNERQAQGVLLQHFYDGLATQEAYSSIIASGANACTLHYRANNRDMQDGDFLLIDAGAEKSYYCADVTRTYPVNGTFTSEQRDLYQAVLSVQEQVIDKAVVGSSLPELHDFSVSLLTQAMLDLKLLSGSVDQHIQDGTYKKYYPHGLGHYLGMDVHDVGLSRKEGVSQPLAPGMIHTVEPGLYIPTDDDSAPAGLRGLGVRIEDDILITKNGPEVLTKLVPKTIAEMEALIGN